MENIENTVRINPDSGIDIMKNNMWHTQTCPFGIVDVMTTVNRCGLWCPKCQKVSSSITQSNGKIHKVFDMISICDRNYMLEKV